MQLYHPQKMFFITLLIFFDYSVNGKKWIIKSSSQQRTISEQRTIAAARKCPLVGDSTVYIHIYIADSLESQLRSLR